MYDYLYTSMFYTFFTFVCFVLFKSLKNIFKSKNLEISDLEKSYSILSILRL